MNSPPWKAEKTVSNELAKKLIDEQFPELNLIQIENFGEGWDNTAFLVNNEYVFRFPRRQISEGLLENELKILPYLKTKLPLQIPYPEFMGQPTEDYTWPFAGYVKLPGTTACGADLSTEDRINNAEILARFLAALHAIPVQDLEKLEIKTDTLGRVDLTKRIPMTLKNLQEIEELQLFTTHPLQSYLKNLPKITNKDSLCLTHGDLYIRHILVDDQKKVTGIIDWGDSELGYPALDLAIAHAFLPPQAHEMFRKAYGTISAENWEIARIRAIFSLSYIILYGNSIKDTNLVKEGFIGLQYICQKLNKL